MMSTPLAFDIVENSMRNGGQRRYQSGLLQRSTKGTPELVTRLRHGCTSVMGPTLPFIPYVHPISLSFKPLLLPASPCWCGRCRGKVGLGNRYRLSPPNDPATRQEEREGLATGSTEEVDTRNGKGLRQVARKLFRGSVVSLSARCGGWRSQTLRET